MKKIIFMMIMVTLSPLLKAENKVTCDEVLQACDEALVSEQGAHAICEDIVKVKEEKIKADEKTIKELSDQANHSHVPIIAATSGFWIALKFLLVLL